MKKIILLITVVLVIMITTFTLAGCQSNLPYYDETEEVNGNLFYKNELSFAGADPDCIYVSEGEGAGYFYLYTTTDAMMNKGFYAWRSRNLNDWEAVGAVFQPEKDSLCKTMLWAPEVIYNPIDQLYYLYYSALRGDYKKAATGDIEYLTLCVAYSSSPCGPFVQWEGVNALGQRLDRTDELINFQANLGTERHWCTIDASPFFDDDGTLYLYFSQTDPVDSTKTGIYGMKMLDAVTPDYTTVTQLTKFGSLSMDTYSLASFDGENINEAPYMLKHNGKYYLTYSTYGYTSPNYRVCLAVSDNPLANFVKNATGNPILGKEPYFDHMTGTGHHCFVKAGEQLFAVYHAHTARGYTSQAARSIAFDEAFFTYDETLGFDTIHVNGPTYSVQPLPTVYTGYANCMADAKIEVTNLESGSADLLNDRIITIHPEDLDKEILVNGKTKITITFNSPKTISAVMVYNSQEISYSFDKLDQVDLTLDTSSISKDSAYYGLNKLTATDVKFSEDNFMEDIFIRPGGASICEFADVAVKKIEITISSKYLKEIDDNRIGISEIIVLAKEEK